MTLDHAREASADMATVVPIGASGTRLIPRGPRPPSVHPSRRLPR